MAETAIFRPREESEDREFMEKVEPVQEMDMESTDSSLTGVNSASEETTITVHRIKETKSTPTPQNPMVNGSKTNQTNQTSSPSSTNPVTPDTSVDGGLMDPSTVAGLTTNPLASSDEEIGEQRESGAIEIERESTTPKEETNIGNSVHSGRRSTYSSSNSRRMMRRNGRSLRDDDSSSDDDSSYFATHLPSPKSGRSFSISSNTSNASALFQIQKQGSDASLSFSDESDDEHHHHHHQSNLTSGVHLSPVINPNRTVVDMNLYPQRITRMHSVSSLVSSASSDNQGDPDTSMLSEDDNGSNRRRSYTGDESVNSSLPSVASTGPDAMNRNLEATGGYFVHGSSTLHNYQLSQPAITGMSYYSPQAPTLTNQQMQAWASPPPKDTAEFEYTSSSDYKMNVHAVPQMGSQRSSLHSQSSGSLNYNFTEEDDKRTVGQFQASASMGKQQSNGGSAAGNGAGAGGIGGFPGPSRGSNGGTNAPKSFHGAPRSSAPSVATAEDKLTASSGGGEPGFSGRQTFKVYWQRWIMLFYMSVLNLLSDWTCYSVAPISLLTEKAFGDIDPERLVVVFLGANAVASACEPMILARLGLRRTVLLGSFLLTIGSIIKSGGLPPFFEPTLEVGHAESSLYLGFFIVGLSQPLYQCTPALLSASWFPEEERTMATGVALNANQLGIGFAFIFGTLLVAEAEDIIPYFGLLSQISTLCLIGTLIQFDDAPPTPPSASARVMRGNLNFSQIRSYFTSAPETTEKKPSAQAPTPASNEARKKRSGKSRKASPASNRVRTARRRNTAQIQTANSESGLSAAPSSAHYGSTADAMRNIAQTKAEVESLSITPRAHAPSPAGEPEGDAANPDESNPEAPPGQMPGYYGYGYPPPPPDYQYYHQMQMQAFYQQQMFHQQQMQQQQQLSGQPPPPPMPMPYFPPPQHMPMPYSYQNQYQAPYGGIDYRPDAYDFDDEGAEPTVTVTNHHLDIDIRDDQVIRSLHACMIRQGFSHALAAFTVSGIVINTLSTYMDYLVRLNGAPRSYTGIVGGAFQFGIMISSLIMGKQTDNTRAYYSVTTGMLVVGAFGLAECGVSLDSNRGSNLRWSLLLVAVLVGPLQPISTELGVEVAYPLSENTVLVIQQLFSNLLSALFIPFFKSLKDIGTIVVRGDQVIERPEYTFSFYLLIVLHTLVTVYFATFNGRYLRYEHELQKRDEEEAKEDAEKQALLAGEQAPLMANATQ